MKNKVKLSMLVLPLVLVGCTSNSATNVSDNKITNSPKESITLSASNYSTYIATNSSSTLLNNSYNDVIYYTYFTGADYCKFVNCKITYKYVENGGDEGSSHTISLNLSGDGEATPFFVRNQNRYTYYYAVITGATGTVEVYR